MRRDGRYAPLMLSGNPFYFDPRFEKGGRIVPLGIVRKDVTKMPDDAPYIWWLFQSTLGTVSANSPRGRFAEERQLSSTFFRLRRYQAAGTNRAFAEAVGTTFPTGRPYCFAKARCP
jgi:hypothetical protein